mmetsp:Transcript_34294/g.25376  ORF Transcript_34294/g.25376 Transcript_34294/m.25376 type:complete len:91 (+) Transcript_34294:2565-2837(+)
MSSSSEAPSSKIIVLPSAHLRHISAEGHISQLSEQAVHSPTSELKKVPSSQVESQAPYSFIMNPGMQLEQFFYPMHIPHPCPHSLHIFSW